MRGEWRGLEILEYFKKHLYGSSSSPEAVRGLIFPYKYIESASNLDLHLSVLADGFDAFMDSGNSKMGVGVSEDRAQGEPCSLAPPAGLCPGISNCPRAGALLREKLGETARCPQPPVCLPSNTAWIHIK